VVDSDVLLTSPSGTFKTPQLLELSGIGDRSLLKRLDIENLIDLPGVGENLLDQTYTLIDYVARKHVKTLGTYLPSFD
jgi:choline dehydrogenase-like flavoprotein